MPIEYRSFRPSESDVLPRFFLQAGYMLPVTAQDRGWGAWSDGELVGALALSRFEESWLLRGPEIVSAFRRRGVGSSLLELALPEIRDIACYCAAYSNVVNLYMPVGFTPCPEKETPAYLSQQMAIFRRMQWDLVLLRRLPEN
jgi:predicted N-acetyltransferase YhbS